MGNLVTKVSKYGWINWQHRPLHEDKNITNQGLWISYGFDTSNELEQACTNEGKEPVYTLNESHLYHGDQILFTGDIAARLGGPFVHRNKNDKSLKELRRVGYAFVYQDKGSFAEPQDITDINDKAVMLTTASVAKVIKGLTRLVLDEFEVPEDTTSATGFVRIAGNWPTSKLTSSEPIFYMIQVTDTAGKSHEVVVQKHDFDIIQIESAIASDLRGKDSKEASLLMNEARLSLAIDCMTRTLAISSGNGVFARVIAEIDTTSKRKEKWEKDGGD